MAERTSEQWLRAVRRWLAVGTVAGLGFGVFAHLAFDDSESLLGSLAFYLPVGAALALMLWASAYRYDFGRVWGWRLMGLTFGLLGLLIATAVGVGCLQGICGER